MNESLRFFCRLPWEGLDISPQGEFKPCCKYRGTVATGFTEYIASPELKQLRELFLEGKKPDKCVRCWNDEEAGIKSKRQIEFDNHLVEQPVNKDFKIVSLSFGNTCNLACRSCSSYASSKWLTEAKKLHALGVETKQFPHTAFYKQQEFTENIKQISKHASLIEIVGGEPFYTGLAEHKEFLRYLTENSPAEKSLHYVTNVTAFPDDEFWDLWKNFKNVDIQLSIDGVGKQFEYLRWPAKWGNAYSNIKKYQQKKEKITNLQLSISHTVSSMNVYYLPEFLQWCKQEELPVPYCGKVHTPEYYDIATLPQHIKCAIFKKFGDNTELAPMVAAMQKNEESMFAEFTLMLDTLDKMRNQSFDEVFPEYAQIIKTA
jgi:MoaA/NifB/PqqE/SkfB family radical SAM enzyme